MKRWRGILGMLVLLIGVPLAALSILWKDRCKSTRMVAVPSPQGDWVAVLVTTDCGPTMQVATEVRLEDGSQRDEVSLVPTDVDTETVLVLAGTPSLPMSWSPGSTLTIQLPDDAQVVKHRRRWRAVTVVFAGGPSAPRVAPSAGTERR